MEHGDAETMAAWKFVRTRKENRNAQKGKAQLLCVCLVGKEGRCSDMHVKIGSGGYLPFVFPGS